MDGRLRKVSVQTLFIFISSKSAKGKEKKRKKHCCLMGFPSLQSIHKLFTFLPNFIWSHLEDIKISK
jgi:hypothetical protein